MKKGKPFVLILFVSLLLLGACSVFEKLDYPAEEYVKADRKFHSLLVTEKVNFPKLVQETDLTDVEKTAVLQAFSDWEFMIRQAEEAQGITPGTE